MCDDFMKRKNYIIFFIIFILIFSCGKNKAKEEKEKNDVNIARENEKQRLCPALQPPFTDRRIHRILF